MNHIYLDVCFVGSFCHSHYINVYLYLLMNICKALMNTSIKTPRLVISSVSCSLPRIRVKKISLCSIISFVHPMSTTKRLSMWTFLVFTVFTIDSLLFYTIYQLCYQEIGLEFVIWSNKQISTITYSRGFLCKWTSSNSIYLLWLATDWIQPIFCLYSNQDVNLIKYFNLFRINQCFK